MYTIPVGAAVLGGPPDRPTHPAGAAPCAPPGRLRTSAPTSSSPAPYPSLRCSEGLAAYLPQESVTDNGRFSPADRYAEIRQKVLHE